MGFSVYTGDAGFKPFVTADPDTCVVELRGHEDYLILACDGLWDEMTPESAMLKANRFLLAHPDRAEDVAKELADSAKKSGSMDNITVIVVFLKPAGQLIEELRARAAQGLLDLSASATATADDANDSKNFGDFSTNSGDRDDFADLVDTIEPGGGGGPAAEFDLLHAAQNPFDTTPLDSSVLGDFGTPSDLSSSEIDWDFKRVPINFNDEESHALNVLDQVIDGAVAATAKSTEEPAATNGHDLLLGAMDATAGHRTETAEAPRFGLDPQQEVGGTLLDFTPEAVCTSPAECNVAAAASGVENLSLLSEPSTGQSGDGADPLPCPPAQPIAAVSGTALPGKSLSAVKTKSAATPTGSGGGVKAKPRTPTTPTTTKSAIPVGSAAKSKAILPITTPRIIPDSSAASSSATAGKKPMPSASGAKPAAASGVTGPKPATATPKSARNAVKPTPAVATPATETKKPPVSARTTTAAAASSVKTKAEDAAKKPPATPGVSNGVAVKTTAVKPTAPPPVRTPSAARTPPTKSGAAGSAATTATTASKPSQPAAITHRTMPDSSAAKKVTSSAAAPAKPAAAAVSSSTPSTSDAKKAPPTRKATPATPRAPLATPRTGAVEGKRLDVAATSGAAVAEGAKTPAAVGNVNGGGAKSARPSTTGGKSNGISTMGKSNGISTMGKSNGVSTVGKSNGVSTVGKSNGVSTSTGGVSTSNGVSNGTARTPTGTSAKSTTTATPAVGTKSKTAARIIPDSSASGGKKTTTPQSAPKSVKSAAAVPSSVPATDTDKTHGTPAAQTIPTTEAAPATISEEIAPPSAMAMATTTATTDL